MAPPDTGDTLAVARALSELSEQLYAAAPARATRPRRWLAEIAGYLGGGLLLGGAALLVATSWADLSRPTRIVLLTAVSVVLLVSGLIAVGRSRPVDGVRLRLAGVLLALAAGTSAPAAGTAAHTHEVFWAGTAGFVVAVLGYLVVRSVAGVLTSAAFSAVALGALAGEVMDADAVVVGVVLVVAGLAWAALAATGVVVPRHAVFAAAAVIAFVGAQQPLGEQEGWAYGLTFGVAVVWLAGYLWQRSPVLLVAGIVGVTVAVPEALWDWTDGAVGGAVSALIAGAVLLVASALGFRGWTR